MFVVAPSTVWNSAALETRSIPKRVLGRIGIFPRRGADAATLARLAFEAQPLRYGGTLVPFVVAMLVWPHLALPIAQAPLAMLIFIGFVEMKLLRVAPEARQSLIGEAEAARILDGLRFRANAALRRIAAHRDLREGELHLVVEQSELARITPLTLVSVQYEGRGPQVLDPDEAERDQLRGIFDADLTERELHMVNLRENEFLRVVAFDCRGVSAHARLAAMMTGGARPAIAG